MEANKKKILVVDDEQDLCEILKFNLETEGYQADTANSGEEAMSMDIASYDLLLLDVMMGGMSGFQLAKQLKENPMTAHVPIIFLTARDTENDTVTGFNLGADDYISKPFEPRELLARIRAVLRRHEQPNQADSQSDSLTFGRLSVFPDSHEVTIDDKPVRLTTHQFQLLHYFATHAGKVLNREQLWQAMPNDDSSDNIDRAIDVHISRLRALIEDNPRQPKRIITVRGVGYQFATDQV